MKFYPDAWQSDGGLAACSLAARGLWIELIAIMHKSERYGFLLVNGAKPNVKKLSFMCRTDVKSVEKCLSELASCGVYSEDENGVIYSRRMVKDFEKSQRDAENGGKGGNPHLTKKEIKGVNHSDNSQDKATDKAKKIEDRSKNIEKKEESPKLPLEPEQPGAENFGGREMSNEEEFKIFYEAYPRKKNRAAARRAFATARKKASLPTLLLGLKDFDWPRDPNYCPYPASWLNGERWLDQATSLPASENDRRIAELEAKLQGRKPPPDDDDGNIIDGDFENV